eukprot:403366456
MTQRCCGCCKLKRAVLIIFILDIIGLASFFFTISQANRRRNNKDEEWKLISDYIIERKPDITGLDFEELSGMLDDILNLLLAIPILILVLVYIPRVLIYIKMKCKHADVAWRLRAYKIRVFTTVMLILLEVAVIIGCGILLGKSKTLLAPQAVPAIVGYLISLIYDICFDIYFCVIYKRYHNQGLIKQQKRQFGNRQQIGQDQYGNIQNYPQMYMADGNTMGGNIQQQMAVAGPYGPQYNQQAQIGYPANMVHGMPIYQEGQPQPGYQMYPPAQNPLYNQQQVAAQDNGIVQDSNYGYPKLQ